MTGYGHLSERLRRSRKTLLGAIACVACALACCGFQTVALAEESTGEATTLSSPIRLEEGQYRDADLIGSQTVEYQFTIDKPDLVYVLAAAVDSKSETRSPTGAYRLCGPDGSLLDVVWLWDAKVETGQWMLPAGTYTIEYSNYVSNPYYDKYYKATRFQYTTQKGDFTDGQVVAPDSHTFVNSKRVETDKPIYGYFYWGAMGTAPDSRPEERYTDRHFFSYTLDHETKVQLELVSTGVASIAEVSSNGYVFSGSAAHTAGGKAVLDLGTCYPGTDYFVVETNNYLTYDMPFIARVVTTNLETSEKIESNVIPIPSSVRCKIGDDPRTVRIAGVGDGEYSLGSYDSSVADLSLSGKTITVTPKSAGTFTVEIFQSEGPKYRASSGVLTVTVEEPTKQLSLIHFSPSYLNLTEGGEYGTVSITRTGDGALSVSSSDETVASAWLMDEYTLAVAPQGAGSCSITVSAAETDSYEAGERSLTVNVAPGSTGPTEGSSVEPERSLVELREWDNVTTVRIDGVGDGELMVNVSDPAVAYAWLSDTTLYIQPIAAGTCTITIKRAETEHFTAARGEVQVVVKGEGEGDEPGTGGDEDTVPIYRVYNEWSGEHIFTTEKGEYDALGRAGWTQEDIAWRAPAFSDTPVYRLYNPYTGDHHYTTNYYEYIQSGIAGWDMEGTAFYSAGKDAVPVYRLYNRWVSVGTHHYTTSFSEYNGLASTGWIDESIGWYAL